MLQYAYDTLVLIEENPDAAKVLKILIFWFGKVLGLHLNLGKSKIFLINTMENLEEVRDL